MNFQKSHASRRFLVGFVALLLLAAPASFAFANVSISLQSLSPSTSISVGTNLTFTVSASGFTNPTYAVSDSFSGGSVTSSNINSSGNFAWTPGSADIGTHNLTITVSDSQGDTATTLESITVSAAPSVSIQSLSPSSSVTINQTVSFTAATTGFSNPTYSVSDSFGGSTVSNSAISSSGVFSWEPGNANQDGTHTITIYVSDSSGHSANVNETIIVQSAATVVIQSLSPSSNVAVGQSVTFTAAASNFSSPTYSVSDSFGGSTVSNSDINSSGNFNWSPSSGDVGTHTITVTAVDNSGHTATASQTITVGSSGTISGTGNASIQGLSPGTTVIEGQTVSFTVAASGFSNPVFSVSDNFSGTTISTSNINSAGYFSWTSGSNQIGTHNVTIYVNDSSGHTGSVTLSLSVNNPSIAITSVNPGGNVLPNATLTFTASPAGFTNPNYTVSDSFSGTTITDADISSSGAFSWIPVTSQLGSHTITVYATDAYGHSASTQLTVDVTNGTSVVLTAVSPSSSVTNGSAVSFSAYAYGFTAPTYSVQDSFSGTSLSSSAISSSGSFYWIPTAGDVGVHTLTVTAYDQYGHTGSAQTTITVASGGTSGSTLSQLEAQLQQTEAALTAAGGTPSTGLTGSYVFMMNLAPGETSNDVQALQTVLTKENDFTGSITGYYGALTETAVKKFQAQQGIAQLGSVGPLTRTALNALMVPITASSGSATSASASNVGDGYVFNNFIGYGQQGTDVTELQKRLSALGFYGGAVTGYFGDLTRAALLKFQAAHGVNQVGYVGPGTRAALNR